jgi:hypothetical protein
VKLKLKLETQEEENAMRTVLSISLVAIAALVAVEACTSDSDPAGGGSVTPDGGGGVASDAASSKDSGETPSTNDAGNEGGGGGGECSAAREALLKPIDSVSTGEVTVLAEATGVTTLFVDATAGGSMAAATNPRLYLNLETKQRVPVTDKTASTSTAWDLALKRPILFTNSGHGGTGQGGAFLIDKAFDAVTLADSTSKPFTPESFFDADCNAKVDATNAVKTSFDGWYDYDTATNTLAPHAGTWIVKGGTGKLFKVQVLSYYATPDGGTGQAGGRFTLKVGAL